MNKTVHTRTILAVLVLVALAGVFMLYTQPDFMVQMADQLWTCF